MPPPPTSFTACFPNAPNSVVNRARELERSKKRSVDLTPTSRPSAVDTPLSRPEDSSSWSATPQLRRSESLSDASRQHVDDTDSLPGDMLNTVGSASSHASTSSSVFSSSSVAQNAMTASKSSSSHVTPLTNLGSPSYSVASNPQRPPAPTPLPSEKAEDISASTSTASNGAPPNGALSSSTPGTIDRVPARDTTRSVLGTACKYDPLLDRSLSSDKKKAKPVYKDFGLEDDDRPPSDPRQAKGGRLNYINVDYHHAKARLRHAPYNVRPYPYDPRVTIGPGPPTQIVVMGFNPIMAFSRLIGQFATYGEIEQHSNKMHPETGSYLGFATFRYKDSKPNHIRPHSVSAIDAAKRALRAMNGHRFDTYQIRVEYDADGRKSGRMMEDVLRKEKEKAAKPDIPTAPKGSDGLTRAPPTAPTGPAALRQSTSTSTADGSRPPPKGLSTEQRQAVVATIEKTPCIFIPHASVPVSYLTVSHMKKRLRGFTLEDILILDKIGYYITFVDSECGRSEASRCIKCVNHSLFFDYTVEMTFFPFGVAAPPLLQKSEEPMKPRRRSRTPERNRTPDRRPPSHAPPKQDDQTRRRRDEDVDVEEEKKQRAKDFDPVREAVRLVRQEMTEHLIRHIRAKVATPALISYLDPANHVAKRRKLNIADHHTDALSDGDDRSPSGTPNAREDPIERRTGRIDVSALPRIRKATGAEMAARMALGDPFERRRRPLVRSAFRSLHDRLKVDSDSDSEEEDVGVRETEEPESRPRSRMSTDEDVVQDELESWSRQEEDSMTEASFAANDSSLLASKKRKLDVPLETAIKRQKKSESELFGVAMDKVTTDLAIPEAPVAEDIVLPDVDPEETESSRMPTPAPTDTKSKKKAPKAKKKTKKQLFEEREAQRLAEQETLQKDDEETQPEDHVEPGAVPEPSPTTEELKKPEPTEAVHRIRLDPDVYPDELMSALVLPADFELDIGSLDSLSLGVNDRPDTTRLKRRFQIADIGDPEFWVWRRDRIKSLNVHVIGQKAQQPKIEGYYIPNPTGCARTEGIKKILNSEKSKYLPHHIKVKKAREERQAEAKNVSSKTLAAVKVAEDKSRGTSRANRANQRRAIAEIYDQKRTLGQDSDVLRFNQLKKRKKPVKFERSAIHNWGLYAMESIPKDDMIIEYVGEEVRPSVAQVREARYDRSGIGSSYLFRIDEDAVIDATKKGGIARFINHSCMPNCTAKIIRVEGTKRIVIYALRDIARNEELTYDYKFELEEKEEDRVPCLCGTTACKGFLN